MDARDVKSVRAQLGQGGLPGEAVEEAHVFLLDEIARERRSQIETVTFFLRQVRFSPLLAELPVFYGIFRVCFLFLFFVRHA